MADTIRQDILEAAVEMFEDITVANGYRNTIVSAEVLAKCHDDPTIGKEGLPWIGIVPQDEIITDESFGNNKVDWPITILSHFHIDQPGTATTLIAACTNMFTDIRRTVYENPTLGVEGVILTKITSRIGSEGSDEAVRLGRGSLMVKLVVRFLESVSAT